MGIGYKKDGFVGERKMGLWGRERKKGEIHHKVWIELTKCII